MKSKKKILFVNNTFSRAGAEMALLDLFYALDPEKYDISFFVLSNQGELAAELPEYVRLINKNYSTYTCLDEAGFDRFKKELRSRMIKKGVFVKGVPYGIKTAVSLKKSGRFDLSKLARKFLADSADVPEEIKNTRYDLAIAFVEGGSAFYIRKNVKADKKYAFIHVDYEKAGYDHVLDDGVYDAMDRIYAVSEEVKTAFLKAYPQYESKAYVFENVINPQRVLRRAESADAKGFDDGYTGFRIVTVARLYPQKAIDYSVRAAKLLAEKGLDFKWHVFGDGVERDKLTELIDELGLQDRFILEGNTDNPYAYMKAADVYVHATAFEGKSIAIREAQILGRPIVLTDCSGNREQAVDMQTGLFCRLDEADIAEKIRLLYDDEALRIRLGKNAAGIDQKHEAVERLIGDV